MWTSFHMNIQSARTRLGKCFEVTLRLFDHQMHIQREICDSTTGFHDKGSHRNVGNKVPIHHIDVKPIRAGRFTSSDLLPETREISRENGWSNGVLFH